MFSAGDQVPVIPLLEVVGRGFKVPPVHMADTASKVGVTGVLIVMLSVAVVAHRPAVGVNVYTVVPRLAVFMEAGLQVPVIPFEEVAGRAGGVAF